MFSSTPFVRWLRKRIRPTKWQRWAAAADDQTAFGQRMLADRVFLAEQASVFSLPLFERIGFTVIGMETVERRGVQIERHRIEMVPPRFV